MGSLSLWHLTIVLIYVGICAGVVLIPCWRIVVKAGYAGAWSILILVPPVNLILIWVFAFIKWPIERAGSQVKG